ncbi:MAG TPA: hypothetical protein VMM76_15365 [Pirellulaceae bacterium]|nr:hypothetical protein [Pirellulaceae bacterium]
MSDNFNPYSEWLGLAATMTSPNHYQLLGIDESVTDPATINSAADRATTRVRACKPGGQARAWAQLLDRITEAKSTLTDRTLRERYDLQRKSPAVQTGAPLNPNLLPPTHYSEPAKTASQPLAQAIDPMSPMAPVAVPSQPTAPWGAQPVQAAAVPQAVPYLQPATLGPAAPNPMAPVASAVPVAPTIPQAMQNPMAPAAQTAPFAPAIPVALSPMTPLQPAAIPVATSMPQQAAPFVGPIAAPQPQAAPQLQPIDGAPRLKRKPAATARTSSKSGGALSPIVLGGAMGSLIVVLIGLGFYLANRQPETASQPVVPANSAPIPASGGEVASTIPRRLDEMPESERPQPQTYTLPTQAPLPETFSPVDMTPAPEPAMEPVPAATPQPSTPETMAEPAPSREELRSLAQSLTTARAAIGELNFPVAEREIAKSLALAKLDEHKAKIRRLQMLSDYVTRFHAAIGTTLGRVEAGEQIDLGDDKFFVIVEVTPDLLVIHFKGRNLRYPMTELPAGLATRLAEMSLDKAAPETLAMKAAFVSVNPKVSDEDLEMIRTWWDEAASVPDVPDLLTAINDDYSLKQSMMAVPLEPNAMAELTARADRLKDARTIEAFAKEYQAAIDESLKTLEPETELSVGGSTNVVIKELKPDRVMLTIVGETRGFQFTKLPLGLAASIADRILPRDVPLTMVMKGAYFAAREKDQANKQFRTIVVDLWKQAGEMDPQLQPTISELATQYPE